MSESLKRLADAADARRAIPELIRQARRDGHTWEQISEAAQMSRAGVIKAAKER